MMGQGGMMDMMAQMSGGMIEDCSEMMQRMDHGHGVQRPNEQWRDEQAPPPDAPRPQANDR